MIYQIINMSYIISANIQTRAHERERGGGEKEGERREEGKYQFYAFKYKTKYNIKFFLTIIIIERIFTTSAINVIPLIFVQL